ncbi:MsnO8 family LLM class oxidoreductase [Chryseobacterium sp. WG14]|uniref:MsnO8 family LLM class oxidoreductase n=1 Tax=unclassified Chryseobacterium TaxID=2593645 RepID=UPI00211F3384|nr:MULTISPECIES: MsnO8 family LLM class oxidoreductase [unclassified Chryseobacterium]MCQ9636756.1 MsnO8 family LLM class oxidoreductase [Chryseobacterium sp. WG23]MCQ9639373.1 MsnO8 family LLM class oxidoreductase [Chryseobacterium sp. WG14]
MKLKLGILDQSPTSMGGNASSALTNSINLALLAEETGFHSVMYAEHHGVEAYGSSSPELLAAIILSKTKRIKVGTAGIMMRNYSAYKIAEWTKLLGSIYPGRFILGLGKAPGGLKDAVMALNNHKPVVLSNMETKLQEIIQLIKEEKGVYESLIAQPTHLQHLPEIIWLGSGMTSAIEAAKHGIGYSFAAFMNSENGKENTEAYLQKFDRTQYTSSPSLQVTVAASVAETIEKATRNAYGMAYQFLQSRQLVSPEALFPPEIVEQKVLGTQDEKEFFRILDRMVIETSQSISARLEHIAEKYNTDNILVLSNMYREEDRISTYQNIIKNNK